MSARACPVCMHVYFVIVMRVVGIMVRSLATGITLGLTKSLYLDLTLYFRCRRRLPVVCKHKQGALIQDHLSSRLEVQVPWHCQSLHAHQLLTTAYSHVLLVQSKHQKGTSTGASFFSGNMCIYIYSIFYGIHLRNNRVPNH